MKYNAIYRGIARDNNDPRMVGRIRAEVPAVFGTGEDNWTLWAWPSMTPGTFEVPKEGDGVWIMFENGDPTQPVWTGIWYRGNGPDTTDAPFQELHPALTDMDGVEVDWDKRDHVASVNKVDDLEHKEYPGHDHSSQFYSPHRSGHSTASGHRLEFNDHPGTEGSVTLADRFNRLVTMAATGILKIRSAFYGASESQWQDLNGANVDAEHHLIFQDLGKDAPQQFIELMDMAGAKLRMNSTPGDEYVEIKDFWGQKLRIRTKSGEESIEVLDKAGQKIKLDVATGTVRVDDANDNFILMADGKIVLSVPAAAKVHIGGEGGQQLATKTFVQSHFNTHTHLSGAPGSPTSPPMAQAPMTPGVDVTKKGYSE